MRTPQAYTVRKARPADLTPDEIETLWRFHRQFVDCPRDHFLRTLAGAEQVYLCHDRASACLRGFEAVRIVTFPDEGCQHVVVFTFFADLEWSFRGRGILLRIGFGRYLALRLRHPFRRLYWMFSAATYPSYLLMAHNARDYWPRPDAAKPPEVRRIMARAVAELGLEGWDADDGLLRRHGLLRYREGLIDSDAAPSRDRLIRFYAECNPGQEAGDALVCLCPLHLRNVLFALSRRLLRLRE